MNNYYDVLIVGAGHAGAQAAISLRENDFKGSIGIVGAESELPYERPPLSKEYLHGEKDFSRLLIRTKEFWVENEITIKSNVRITKVDPNNKCVYTDANDSIGYNNLIWATGCRARRLTCEGSDLKGVHTVRTCADADSLLKEIPNAVNVVVIGGGYIGLEAAAALVKFGKKVYLLEATDRVLARVAGEPLSRFYEREHAKHGVKIFLNAKFTKIVGFDGAVTGVVLESGEILSCEIVIVGIGVSPEVQPLEDAGAICPNGVKVDSKCRTTLPNIFAIGDCALHSNVYASNSEMRIESVQNANDQAVVASKNIMGLEVDYQSLPWFWSNQYDLKLQTAGLSKGHDDVVLRGNPEERSFSVVYLKKGRFIAIDCVNSVKDFVQSKKLIVSNVSPDITKLKDPSVALKDLI